MFKKTSLFFLSAAIPMFAACNKLEVNPNPNNPPVQTLPQRAFTVKVFVEEQGIIKDSTYVFEGEVKSSCLDGKVAFTSVTGRHAGVSARTFNVDPDIVELVLTPWNSIRFETTAPVNASSSTDVADIVMDGGMQNYTVKANIDNVNPRQLKAFESSEFFYPEERRDKPGAIVEGTTDIRFWNGADEGSNGIVIRVRTANHIAVEGFELEIDGKRAFLVEGTKETNMGNLSKDAVIAYLPCVAKDREEFYVNGKHDYKTEEVYYTDKFSTIAFIGTVPRNATPDNRIIQIIDPISFIHPTFDDDYSLQYPWSSVNCPDFRWMPFREEVTNCFNYSTVIRLYPADVRYRKSKIWNPFIRELKENFRMDNYFLDYSVTPNPDNEKEVKYYWGEIYNQEYKPN